MRGVVSLATALALPAAFPGRDIIDRRDEVDGETMMTLIRELDLEEEQLHFGARQGRDPRRDVT